MIDEVSAFERLARKFIAPGARDVLSQLGKSLLGYRDQLTESPVDWEIAEANPLDTIVSDGGYERGSGGAHKVFARITCKWRIKKIPKQRRIRLSKQFKLIGFGSTRIRLICAGQQNRVEEEIAMWRMEIGDKQSPGCFFHVQIMGESTGFPFPSSLPVPRLPGIILTPAAATEFVLAELFQEEWASHVARDSADLNRWAPIQKQRLTRLLDWKLSVLNGGGSPWTTMKQRKPDANLFA